MKEKELLSEVYKLPTGNLPTVHKLYCEIRCTEKNNLAESDKNDLLKQQHKT